MGEALPLELVLTPAEADYSALDAAVDLLIDQCMTARGYEYEPYPPRPPRHLLDLRVRYGYLTADEAATAGYRSTIPSGEPPQYLAEVEKIDRDRDAEGPDYLEALFGPNGDGGCRADASTEIWGGPTGLSSVPGYEDLIQLTVQARDLLQSDPDVASVDRSWSICMADRGYHFDSWIDAPVPFLLPGSDVSTAEIEQATVDAECRESVGLEPVLFATETRIQTELIAESPLVDGFSEQISAAIARAKKTGPLS